MASGILTLLDDIAVLADDVALSTKVATQKTSAILADDIAVGAQKATGFEQKRELKVIWAITKGSLLNKLIVLPLSFLLSILLPWSIPIILVLGGLYLLYEGAEKIAEYFHKKYENEHKLELRNSTEENVLEVEKKKIKDAIFTDFILSVEIVILALNSVINQPLPIQIIATSVVAFLATFGVYGLVALIVRIDNVGFFFIKKGYINVGNFLVSLMPKIIKVLTIVGTIAMLLVGGGILSHNIEFIHHYFIIESIPTTFQEFVIGLIVGLILVVIVSIIKRK